MPRIPGDRVEADRPGYTYYNEFGHSDSIEPPAYTDGAVPWIGASWWHPAGWTGDGATANADRYWNTPTTLLGTFLPVVYGSAKVQGMCAALKVNPSNPNQGVVMFFFTHGEIDSFNTIYVNDKDISTLSATDAWFGGYHTFKGEAAGITVALNPGARNYLDLVLDYATYPNCAGVIMKVNLGHEDFPGSFNVEAKIVGKELLNIGGGGPAAVSSNPFRIINDILTDTEQWRGLSSGFVTTADWSWLVTEANEIPFTAEAVKRWEFNGVVGSRDSNEAIRDVLLHASCSLMHINNKFLPVPDWKPKPISGTWAATASATLTGTGGAATTELATGERVFIDGDDGTLRTVLSISGNDSITLTEIVTITALDYGNKVRPISSVHVEEEEWVNNPEGVDTPLAAIPDVVKVNYHTIFEVDQLTARAEDPDGYTAADVKIVELTMTGCAYPGQAERMGHIRRRIAQLAPFSWTGVAAPTTDMGGLLPGDIFTIDTQDGLVSQPVLLLDSTLTSEGVYKIGFREYDFNCYVDVTTNDDDTPVSVGNPGSLTPPDLPTNLDAGFFREGPWEARSKTENRVSTIDGWTVSGGNLTPSGGPAAWEHGIFAPTSTDATITSPEFELGLPRASYLTVMFRMAINSAPAPAGTWYTTPVAELEYWSGVASANTERWSKDITINQDVLNQYLCCFTVAMHATDTKHAFKIRVTGDASQTYILSVWNFFAIAKGSITGCAAGIAVTQTEHANAADTVNYYALLGVDRNGQSQILGTLEQGETSANFYLYQSGMIPHPTLPSNFQYRFRWAAVGPGGIARSDFDFSGGIDVKDDFSGSSSGVADVVIDHTAADWDDAAIAVGRLAAVGTDGVTKEYQTPGTVVTRALVAVTSIDDTDSPYTALTTDYVIMCDCTNGEVVVALPAISGATGKHYSIVKTDVTANPVTVNPNGSETINGATTLTVATRWDAPHIVGVGHAATDWAVI